MAFRSLSHGVPSPMFKPAWILLVILAATNSAAAQSKAMRTTGKQEEGRIKFNGWTVKRTSTPEVLVVEKDGVEARSDWEKVKPSDLAQLADEFERCDLEQFEQVQQHLAQLVDNPKATVMILKSLHTRMIESPYAGMWAAVAMSAGLNESDDAGRVLQQVKNWIEIHRKVNPGVHRQTLSSTLNNLAICNLKNGNGTAAATQLVNALDVKQSTTPVVAHNIRQLLAAPENATMSLTKPSRMKLTDALTRVPVKAAETKMNPGWHYSLDFDVPKGGNGAVNVPGIEPPASGMELISIGTGVVCSPGVVITARRNIDQDIFHGAISVAYKVDNSWDSAPVRTVVYERPELQYGETTVIAAGGRAVAMATKFKILEPAKGSPNAEIAALQVGSIPIKPAMCAKKEPNRGQTLSLKNYSRSLQNLSLGLLSHQGAVRSTGSIIELEELVEGGAMGGGLFDEAGALVGMVYDYEDDESLKAFSLGQVRNWYRSHYATGELLVDDGHAEARRDASVVLVLAWSHHPRTIYSQITDNSKPSGQLFVIDDWCLSCKGTGIRACPNCKGLGTLTERRPVPAGVDFKGNPMTQLRNFPVACPNCKGRKAFDCTDCQGGHLRAR